MRKTAVNYWLDCILFLAGVGLAVSGFVRWLVLPSPGRGGGPRQATFIFDRHTWTEIHQWLAVAIIVLTLVHIVLHWNWIVAMTKRVFSPRKSQ